MASHKPGLGAFDISSAFGDPNKPADLGHYVTASVATALEPAAKPKPKVEPKARPAKRKPRLADMPRPAPAAAVGEGTPASIESKSQEQTVPESEGRPVRSRPRRRDIGSSVEVDDLIDKQIVPALRETGPQRDATASEFFQAAAFLIAPVCQSAQYSRLRPRGRWGTTQARDFIRTLSDLYLEALGENYVKAHYREIRARIEADIEREAAASKV